MGYEDSSDRDRPMSDRQDKAGKAGRRNPVRPPQSLPDEEDEPQSQTEVFEEEGAGIAAKE